VRFVAGAKTGGYQSYVGMPYLPSVCRYFGDGSEESDSNGDGPNVEFDGFGLYLWALHEAVAGGQSALLADAWPKARAGAADVIVSLVEPSGLVAADSGIWEHHWNGKQKHFANTSLTAALGLCAAANLADAAGDGAAVAEGFRAAARRVMAGVESELVAGGVLAGNIEEMASGDALDAAVVEAFGWGLMDPLGDVAGATLDALADGLRVASGHGLGRNDDGGWYDRQEWVFIDLRTATALRRAGRPVQSSDLAGWVLAQSRANLDQVAELYTEDAADYAGAVPMAGFGAASWLLWVLEHEPAADATACLRPPDPPEAPEETSGEPAPEPEPTPEPAPDVPEPGPDGPDPMPDVPSAPDAAPDAVADPAPPAQSGGGCSAGPSPVPLLAVLVAGLGCLTPRRRRGR
jgi:GH15 family glucan-1,4-alpha-glucosidase